LPRFLPLVCFLKVCFGNFFSNMKVFRKNLFCLPFLFAFFVCLLAKTQK
jgi:hypothetical protein